MTIAQLRFSLLIGDIMLNSGLKELDTNQSTWPLFTKECVNKINSKGNKETGLGFREQEIVMGRMQKVRKKASRYEVLAHSIRVPVDSVVRTIYKRTTESTGTLLNVFHSVQTTTNDLL